MSTGRDSSLDAERLTRATTDAAILLEIGEQGLRPGLVDAVVGLDDAGRSALRAALAFEPDARLRCARNLAAALRHGAGSG